MALIFFTWRYLIQSPDLCIGMCLPQKLDLIISKKICSRETCVRKIDC